MRIKSIRDVRYPAHCLPYIINFHKCYICVKCFTEDLTCVLRDESTEVELDRQLCPFWAGHEEPGEKLG